jgi:ATP-dependent exoDNAse (exonuclease V) beta subunit
MAILCRHRSEMDICAESLSKRKLPHQLRRNSSSVFDPAHDSIKVMTLHVSKGLGFPVVALVGAGRMPAEGEGEREEARLFYVGATRATQRLVIWASGGREFRCSLIGKRQDLTLTPLTPVEEEGGEVGKHDFILICLNMPPQLSFNPATRLNTGFPAA